MRLGRMHDDMADEDWSMGYSSVWDGEWWSKTIWAVDEEKSLDFKERSKSVSIM